MTGERLSAGALMAWLVAAAVPSFIVRNPLYLALVLGASWLVFRVAGRGSPISRSWGSMVRFGAFFLALAIPFNALSNHLGQIVLFRLPQAWPIVGGAITLEAAIAGAVSGLALLTILFVFAAFNAAVDHYQLLRAAPAFLFQAGVVVSIAVTFVPQMVMSAREIREAQRIRGHRFHGVRDLLPLVLPLLATSLERAIQLAETMEARGFGAGVRPLRRAEVIRVQVATLASLLAALGGLVMVAYSPARSLWGWALVALGGVGLAATFWQQGKRVRRTRYRQSRWSVRDTAVLAASLLVLGAVAAARAASPAALAYAPYPPQSLWPAFDPWLGMALVFLAVPAVVGMPSPALRAPANPRPCRGLAQYDGLPEAEGRRMDDSV